MDRQFQKWVNLSYLAVAVLVGYVVFSAAGSIAAIYDLEARFRSIELFTRGFSVLAAAIVFGALYWNQTANDFMNEVMVELSRVSWPTQKEASSATFIVIVMVVISGTVLWFLDNLWTYLLKSVV